MAVRLIVGDDDLTDRATNLQWTNVDPGGHETASWEVPNDCACADPGDPVAIWEGLERVWMGHVEEPGQNYDRQRAPGQIGAVGAGAVLKDNDISAVIIDRALSRWQANSRALEIALSVNRQPRVGPSVVPDTTTGAPSLQFDVSGPYGGSSGVYASAWYDAGQGNLIAAVQFEGDGTGTGGSATWLQRLDATDTDIGGGAIIVAADNDAADRALARHTLSTPKRFLQFVLAFEAATATDARRTYDLTSVAVIGDHGLTVRGSAPAIGFYPPDIAGWVVDQLAADDVAIARGVIEDDPLAFVLLQAAYHDPVAHEQIIDDMARLLGWHWGVWAPAGPFGDTPELHFRAPPTAATATVSRSECRELRLAQSLSSFHNQARVRYTDAAGQQASVLVTRPNPRLPAGRDRTLQLDLGGGSATAATDYGNAVLALEEQQTRAAGPCQLPAEVLTLVGRQPAHLLRPGIDRLKIAGLPGAGAWSEADTRRFDTFRVQRTTSARGPGGEVTTTAELDSGANLLEVLNARLAVAAQFAD